MKQVFLAAILLFTVCSTAFADEANILLDRNQLRRITAEEYSAAIRNAPDVNARDKAGFTALHLAAEFGTPEIITALLDAGAKVDAGDKYGSTALLAAATYGTPEHIAALLDAGANVNARTMNGLTALYWAAKRQVPR